MIQKLLRHTVRAARERPYHAIFLLTLVGGAALIWAIVLHNQNSYAAGLTNANLWVDTNGGTCTRQSSPGAYSDAQACATIEAAVAASSAGDSIGIKAGTYGAQNVTSSSTWPGVKIVADDATTLGNLTLNGSWLHLENFTTSYVSMGNVAPASIPNNVVLKGVSSTGGGLLAGGTNIKWIGGTIGPHANDVESTLGLEGIGPNCPSGGGAGCNPLQKVVLDGLHFSNITRSSACITANCSTSMINIDDGVNGLTIKNSTFDGTNNVNAAIINIGDKNFGALAKNLTLENNFFGAPGVATYVFAGGNCSNQGISLRYNTFSTAAGWDNSSYSGCGAQLSSVGNIGTHPTCLAGMTFSHNVWTNGTCGASDINTGSLGLGGSDGFHLTAGSPAIDAGDSANYPVTDHDGNTRYAGVGPDAGADERGATGGTSVVVPSNSATSTISGTATVASSLTTTNGTWTNLPTYYQYQWQRCDSAGANCFDIAGAVSNSYTLVSADNGNTLRAILVAANSAGTASVRSAQSATVAGTPPSNTALPSISGTAAVASVLTTTNGTWTSSPSYTYQWRRCNSSGASCSDISGAVGSTYTPVMADSGNTVRTVVTATNGAGSTPATSAQSNVVQAMLGDFNNDGYINSYDLVVFLAHLQSGSSPGQDLNSDGIVNDYDLVIFLSHYSE